MDTYKVYGIVSGRYEVVRHERVIEEVERAIRGNPDLDHYETETAFYNDFGRMRRIYRFTDVWVEIQHQDFVNPELQLFNSYDCAWPFIVILGAYRIICSNGLVIGQEFLKLKKRHIYEFNKINLTGEVVSALDRFRLQSERWRKWADSRTRRMPEELFFF